MLIILFFRRKNMLESEDAADTQDILLKKKLLKITANILINIYVFSSTKTYVINVH